MTDINIPTEAVEAAARAMCHNAYKHLPEMRDVDAYTPDADYWIAQATAAIRAALAAWPGLNHDSQAWRGYGGEVLILPLPETKKKTQPGAFDYWPAEEEGNWGDD